MSQGGDYTRNHGKDYTGSFILVHETDNAMLLKREGQDDDEGEWVPFSQITKTVRTPGTQVVQVTMSQWIAGKKGFLE